MSEGSVWDGNWVARLYERVRERGYTSLTAFAETRPTASLVELGQGRDARRTAAARSAPTTNCCARFCPTRMSDLSRGGNVP